MNGHGAPGRKALALALAATLGGAALWCWPLPLHLATHAVVVETSPIARGASAEVQAGWNAITANDQDLSLFSTAWNARALAHGRVADLLRQGQCYPMPDATVLGEHLVDHGLLATPWWVASGNPVVAYNLAVLGALLVAATGMFLFLARHAPPAAAAWGAVAFALAVPRLADVSQHPAVVGTHWVPWVLWAFDALVESPGPARAAALAAALVLAGLVGSYPLLVVAIVGAGYAAAVLARRRPPATTLGWCVLGAAPAALVVGALLLEYARVQHDWWLPASPDAKYLVGLLDYLPTGQLPVGIGTFLGLLALAATRRERDDPGATGLAVATLACFLFTTRIGGWSLYEALARHVALLDAVRAPGKAGLGVCLGLEALAAIGWGRAMARLGPGASSALAAALVAVVLVEASPPAWARPLVGDGAVMRLREVAPPADHVDVLRSALGDARDARAVLDLPIGRMTKAPLALVDAAYHGRATSACYNSLLPPAVRLVHAMAVRAHTPTGLEELAAAGFGFIVDRPLDPSKAPSPTAFPPPARLVTIGRDVAVWSLPYPGPTHHDVAQLALKLVAGATRKPRFAPDPPYELDLEVTNRGTQMWAAPRPVEPLFAQVELRPAGGGTAFRGRARGMLPLALSPGQSTIVPLVLPAAPAPGTYEGTATLDVAAPVAVVPDFVWSDESR